ncbi:MAG: putative inner rane transporter yiJE [Pseudomonadota bacterium]
MMRMSYLKKAPSWLGSFLLLGAIWGASFMFMQLTVVEFGPWLTAGLRVGIASLCLWPLLVKQGHTALLRQHWKKLWLVGMLNSGIPFACFSFALLHITTGLSSIMNATVPMLGALVAWLWLHDKPTPWRMLGWGLGAMGISLLAMDKAGFKTQDTSMQLWALAACLTATLCYGIAASFTKKYLQHLPPMLTATGSQLGAAAGLCVPALWHLPTTLPSLNAWMALLVLGVVCTGLAYVLYFKLIAEAGPSRTLSVTFLIPVFALGYGAWWLNERITPYMVGCGAVVLLGTALSMGLWPTMSTTRQIKT